MCLLHTYTGQFIVVENMASTAGHLGFKLQLLDSDVSTEKWLNFSAPLFFPQIQNRDRIYLPKYFWRLSELTLFKCLEQSLLHGKGLVNVRYISNSLLK